MEIIKQISLSKAKVIGFSCFSRNWQFTLHFSQLLRQQCPDKILVFGGPHILFEFYRDNLQYLKNIFPEAIFVVGEGFLPLKNTLDSPLSCQRVFIFQELQDLATLPLCTFSSWNMNTFGFVPIHTHIGCIRRCKFCSECFLYKRIKFFSLEYVIEQLSLIKHTFPGKFISFHDSMFNMNLSYLNQLLEKMIKNNLRIPWEAQISINTEMNLSLLQKMKECGCMNLFIGVESFSSKVLHNMGKGYSQKECIDLFTRFKNAGLFFEISLIVGSPPEEEKDFQETLTFLKKYKHLIPKIAQINVFTPYPPSIWARSPEKNFDKKVAYDRLKRIVKTLEEEKIMFTPYFINNLDYE